MGPSRRNTRALTALLGGASVVVVLSACGGRSEEAYCQVIAEHRTQYESAMDGAMSADSLLTGLQGAADAVAGLGEMWEDAADAAPAEIQTQTETVRDTWNGDLIDDLDSGASLSGLTDAIAAAQSSFQAHQDVDAYTRETCDVEMAARYAEDPDAERDEPEGFTEEPEPSQSGEPGTRSLAPGVEEEPQDQPEDEPGLFAHPSEWAALGPYLVSDFPFEGAHQAGVEGPVNVTLPGQDPVTLDAADLLPGHEVLSERYTYLYDEESPIMVGLANLRTPAQGLDPAREHTEVFVIDIDDDASLRTRNRLPENMGFTNYEVATSDDGVIALNSGGQDEPLVQGIDVYTGDEVWSHAGRLSGQSRDVGFIWADGEELDFGEPCYAEQFAVDVGTGAVTWWLDNRDVDDAGDALGCEDERSLEHYAVYYQGEDEWDDDEADWTHEGAHHLFDLRTGAETIIPSDTSQGGRMHADPVRDWAYRTTADYSVDLEAFTLDVFDLSTGARLYSMAPDQVGGLNLQVETLYDGLLYVTTTDEQLVIDVEAGESIGSWELSPEARIGDHTWMSDGSLHPDWQYDPEEILQATAFSAE